MLELVEAHDRMGQRAEELAALLAFDVSPGGYELGIRRMALSAAVRAYLALEHKRLLEPLRALGTPEARDLADDFYRESHRLRSLYSQHVVDWPAARIDAEWIAYRVASRHLIGLLHALIRLRNGSLFCRAWQLLDTAKPGSAARAL